MLILISDRNDLRRAIAGRFGSHGIPFLAVPYETALFYCRKCEIGGAILDGIPSLAAAEATARKLRAEYPELPLCALTRAEDFPDLPADSVIRETKDASGTADAFLRFYREACGWAPTLSGFALFVGEEPEKTTLLGYPLRVTPREHAILRYLYYRHPKAATNDEIMTVCFPEATQKVGILTVLISRINRQAEKITGSALIRAVYGSGYRLTVS